jgi:hypothetical protein
VSVFGVATFVVTSPRFDAFFDSVSTMTDYSRHRARTWVVVGFLLTAVGSMWIFIREVTSDHLYSESGFWNGLETTLVPVMALVALYAWWWLTKLAVEGTTQVTVVRKAFKSFACYYAISSTVLFINLFQFRAFGTFSGLAPLWVQAVGAFVTFLGFIFLSREF